MHLAAKSMDRLLKKSISTGKSNQSNWRTNISNFYPSPDGKVTPGCINVSPAWFQQGREVPAQLIAYSQQFNINPKITEIWLA